MDDPILEEFKFCDKCEPHVLELVKYVRNLENALVVAKQAIESISSLNSRLTDKYHKLMADFKFFEEKHKKLMTKREGLKLKSKLNEMDKYIKRFENRQNIVLS